MTLRIGPLLYACDAIAEPAPDPDRISDDPWCGGAVGALEDGRLTDPRLALCTAKDGRVTAFVWVEVESPVRWVGVRGRGRALELYQVAGGLPVRVAATREVDPEGSASLDLVEYDADGAELRSYTLSALVAG